MFSIPKRGRHLTRLAVGLAALGATVISSSVAMGAMGTSNPITSQLPDLRSATIVDPQIVRFCFDTGSPISSVDTTAPDNFKVGGYEESDENEATAVGSFNVNCVDATFSGGIDLPNYSYGQVDSEAVETVASGITRPNIDDSTALIGSTGENGTRGRTTGNDLLSAFTTPTGGGGGTITYLTDQVARVIGNVTCEGTAASGSGTLLSCPTDSFFFYNQQGDISRSTHVQAVSGNNIRASFAVTEPVGNAIIVGFDTDAEAGLGGFINARTPETPIAENESLRTALSSVPVVTTPATLTNDPDLVTNELVVVGGIPTGQVDFNYDRALSGPSIDADQFTVFSSERAIDEGNSFTPINGNQTVRVDFDGEDQNQTEFYVRAGASDGAGGDAVSGDNSTAGGKPIGGNDGAKHTGYSTGPDAQGPLTLDPGSASATFQVDQRVNPNDVDLSDIKLVDNQGAEVGDANGIGVNQTGTPAPVIVTVTFDSSGDLANAVGISLEDDALGTLPGPLDVEQNVEQVFGP